MPNRRIGTALVVPALGIGASVSNLEAALFVLWLATLVILSWCDLRTRRIPTGIVNPATLAGAVALGATAWRTGAFARLGAAVATAAAAYAAFAVLHALNPGGLGYGDVRLSGLLGLFLGWLEPAAMPAGALLGAGGAALVALVMLVRSRDRRATLPFGPFLAGGAATVALLHSAAPLGFG